MIRLVLLLLLFLPALSGCQKSDSVLIEGVQEVNFPKRCFNISAIQLMINDSTSYVENILNQKIINDSCNNYQTPNIDFTEHTLLGQFTDVVGCKLSYKREVFANSEMQTYTYHITVTLIEPSSCETKQHTSMNWIILPKVPENYEVLFTTTYESNP